MDPSTAPFPPGLLVSNIAGRVASGSAHVFTNDGWSWRHVGGSCFHRQRRRRHLGVESLEHPPYRRQRQSQLPQMFLVPLMMTFLFIATLIGPTIAAFIRFENCNTRKTIDGRPAHVQFTPLHLYASFSQLNTSPTLNVTVYGNVSGSNTPQTPLPLPDDPQWSNQTARAGKIVDVEDPTPGSNIATTLKTRINVLSYTPYDNKTYFCQTLIHGDCPIGPVWGNNTNDLASLPAFSVSHNFDSAYAFTTFQTTLRIVAGDPDATTIGCISASITPDLGKTISNMLTFIPLIILILVGFATIFAGIYSPWGSSDTFKWTSNYGRDEDLLRLVTPGFGDCLQYIQIVVLTGSLTLNYPGYYQPVVSKASWSTLMFNKSFISHENGTRSLIDGIYVYNGTYGLERLSQLVGISTAKDIWPGMVIWLLSIIALVVVSIQIGFAGRWLFRQLWGIQEEDLRRKNLPFTVGNVLRIVYNYFGLPAIALSMFQFVIASNSPAYTTGLAALFVITLLGFSVWLLILVATTRPRAHLFDDLPTVLLFGPFYNTYSDDAAPFSLIPLMLNFIRGIAIGAVQPSGIAQIVLLAICEVILVLTLHAVRPFPPPTSMNAYHTFFAIVRLFATLLSVAFVPSLGVTEASRGWIGYVILLMHGIVLVFGFFLNALQTIVEVIARLAGAGNDQGVEMGRVAARGGLVKVFGMRQLSKRMNRRFENTRHTATADSRPVGISNEQKSLQLNGRPRSLSGSSAVLLNKHISDEQASVGLESGSAVNALGHHYTGSAGSAYTPTTPGAASNFSFPPTKAVAGSARGTPLRMNSEPEPVAPYYRPPRARKGTLATLGTLGTVGTVGAFMDDSPAAKSRASWASGDWFNKRWSEGSVGHGDHIGPSVSGTGTPNAAYTDNPEHENRRNTTDYAVREVDYYYGVRGPALSNLPTRRLGTGPADPTGPVASAAGWFKSLFGGKTKDKGKGFEVVRSTRAPHMVPRAGNEASEDEEASAGNRRLGAMNGDSSDDEDIRSGDEEVGAGTRRMGKRARRGHDEDDASGDDDLYIDRDGRRSIVPDLPPSLPNIDTGGGIELPSRIASRASSRRTTGNGGRSVPQVPRKSSKRKTASLLMTTEEASALRTIQPSPPSSPEAPHHRLSDLHRPRHLLHPPTTSPSRLPFGSEPSSAGGKRSSMADSTTSSMLRPTDLDRSGSNNSGRTGHDEQSSSTVGSQLGTPGDQGRPTSMGYVPQYRTSDQIHVVEPSSQLVVDYRGSTAELVEGSRKSASSERRPSTG